MTRIFKWSALVLVGLPISLIIMFLLTAFVGGLIPSRENSDIRNQTEHAPDVEIYLISTILHTDIAIPVDQQTMEKFAFLAKDGFPMSHPNLKYLVIGWGSSSFYTSTKTLWDIGLGPTATAITGDNSVMHISPAGELSTNGKLKKLSISRSGYTQLIDNILSGFAKGTDGQMKVLSGVNHGIRDLFYRAKGHFNILQPCNIWTARMLRSAGVKTGIWTPTTYSLYLSVALFQQ